MKGVAARYPAFDGKRGTAVNLEGRIGICRVEHQKAPALAPESKDLLALATYVARQSRGMPIEVKADARTSQHPSRAALALPQNPPKPAKFGWQYHRCGTDRSLVGGNQ